MEGELFAKLLGNVGVPAAVCFYTLFRVNQTLKELTEALNKLTTDVDRRLDKLEVKTTELTSDLRHLQHKE